MGTHTHPDTSGQRTKKMAIYWGMWSWTAVLLTLLIGLSSCAPGATPVPVSTPVSPKATPTSQAQTTPVLRPEDVAWQKVVEAAKREGPLTIYSYHLVGNVAAAVSEAFTKRTGLRLEIVSGMSASSVERVRTEHRIGTPVGSIVTGGTTVLLMLEDEGLTQRIGDLPELRNKGAIRYYPWVEDGRMLMVNQTIFYPVVNRKLVPPGAEPKAYRDLLKPNWKGKLGVENPAVATGTNITYYGLISRGKLDQEYFKALGKQDLHVYPNSGTAMQAVAKGEVPFLFNTGNMAMTPYLTQGVPLQAIDMAEGTVVNGRSAGLVLVQGAPQPNAARVFFNWFMSQEGQTVFHKAQGTISYRNDVPDFVLTGARLTPANPILWTAEDDRGTAQVIKDGVLRKLIAGY